MFTYIDFTAIPNFNFRSQIEMGTFGSLYAYVDCDHVHSLTIARSDERLGLNHFTYNHSIEPATTSQIAGILVEVAYTFQAKNGVLSPETLVFCFEFAEPYYTGEITRFDGQANSKESLWATLEMFIHSLVGVSMAPV